MMLLRMWTLLNQLTVSRTEGAIHRNIDMCPYIVGVKHTKYHVPLTQEVFRKPGMGNGFHQLQLNKESHVVFQTHQGTPHESLFFSMENSSGIFHHQVQKAFARVEDVQPSTITSLSTTRTSRNTTTTSMRQ